MIHIQKTQHLCNDDWRRFFKKSDAKRRLSARIMRDLICSAKPTALFNKSVRRNDKGRAPGRVWKWKCVPSLHISPCCDGETGRETDIFLRHDM